MCSTSAIFSRTRRNWRVEDPENPQLEEMINLNKDEAKDNQEIKEEVQEAVEVKTAERASEPAIS